MRAGEARLRAIGCRRITALVVGDHEHAVGLWTSAGYTWQTGTAAVRPLMEDLAARLAEIPGVEAVTLGGSRATGTARPHSDWDFGLYYRETIDPADIRALGFAGEVFAPNAWGRVPNGGAWLVIDGVPVDLIYRDLATVEAWTADAAEGRFQLFREVGYVAGAPTYSYAAELALNRHLVGYVAAARRSPMRCARRAPPFWRRLAAGGLKFADAHARRDDAVACAGNLAVAALATAHARMCARGEWYLNEKDLVARADLDAVQPELRALGEDLTAAVAHVGALLDARDLDRHVQGDGVAVVDAARDRGQLLACTRRGTPCRCRATSATSSATLAR